MLDVLLNLLLPNWGLYTPWTFGFQALAAIIGFLARVSVENTLLLCPTRQNGGVALNGPGLLLAAGAVGVAANHNPGVGLVVGMAAPEIVRVLMLAAPALLERVTGGGAGPSVTPKGGSKANGP